MRNDDCKTCGHSSHNYGEPCWSLLETEGEWRSCLCDDYVAVHEFTRGERVRFRHDVPFDVLWVSEDGSSRWVCIQYGNDRPFVVRGDFLEVDE